MDYNLDEVFGSDFDDTPEVTDEAPEVVTAPGVETTATAPADEESAAETTQPEAHAQQAQAPAFNPDGPGDLKVALQQARERERIARAELAQFQQAQAQAEQQARDAQFRAQLEEIALEDPSQAAALAAQYQAQQQQNLAAQYQAEIVSQKAAMSLEMARASLPDFDQVIAAVQRPEVAPFVNWAAFDQSPNPAMALYQYAKQYAQASDPQALRESLKAEILAELQDRQTPKQPTAPSGISAIPAAVDAGREQQPPTREEIRRMGMDALDLL